MPIEPVTVNQLKPPSSPPPPRTTASRTRAGVAISRLVTDPAHDSIARRGGAAILFVLVVLWRASPTGQSG
jgi:hypothetical protein